MFSRLFPLLYLPVFISASFQPDGAPFKAPTSTAQGLSASVVFSNLTAPRGITFDSRQNLLVVERGLGVTAFSRTTTPSPGWERTVVVQNNTFTHGIRVDGDALYVSTAGEVLLYKYDPTTRTTSGVPTVLISGVPADGELTTHTLELERNGYGKVTAILVGSGPKTNIDITARDPASGRSQIRRFALNSITCSGCPIPWANGQVIAYGIRNPGGFTFPPGLSITTLSRRTLLVVENGASIDNVTGITLAFANDNPADEVEQVIYSTASATFRPRSYGFPDCTTLWNPSADPVGVPQYANLRRGAQFSLHLDTTHDEAWCQVSSNNVPPVLNFQSHSVPLDITFYQPERDTDTAGFPTSWARHAFVSFHGSFDRSPPTGYGVIRAPYPFGGQSSPQGSLGYSFLIQATNLNTCPGNCIRPVGLAFGKDNRLYASSDTSGEIFVIESNLPPKGPSPANP